MVKFRTAKFTNKFNAAPLWKRFFAYLIDMIIINLVITLPFRSYFNKFSQKNLDLLFGIRDEKLIAITMFIILTVVFYYAILEYKLGQTLGKMIFNIHAVSILGKQLTFSQALLRNITKPFPIVLLVDAGYMFFKNTNQRLFEVFSGTAVVQKEMAVI